MTAPSRVGLPVDGLRAGRDRPEVRSRKRIPTRAKSPPSRSHLTENIVKAPTRERATNVQVSKLSFESHPPRVRKRARVKRSTAAGGSRRTVDKVESEES